MNPAHFTENFEDFEIAMIITSKNISNVSLLKHFLQIK